MNATSTGPLEPQTGTLFSYADDVELTPAEISYLESPGLYLHEQAVLDCMRQFRILQGSKDPEAPQQLHRALAVIQHLMDQ